MIVGNEIHGLKVKHLHVGGVLGSGEVQNGIKGCIQVKMADGVFCVPVWVETGPHDWSDVKPSLCSVTGRTAGCPP